MKARLKRFLPAALLALLAACSSFPKFDSSARAELAPDAILRVALVPGSPTQLLKSPEGDRGMMAELGRQLAADLHVKYLPLEHERLPLALAAVQQGQADITLTNASAARREVMDFSQTVLAIELGFLAGPGSSISDAAQVDRPGVTIAVLAGSTSLTTLPRRLKEAKVVAFATLAQAGERLMKGEVQLVATNKVQLYQLSDRLPGSRVLPGNWGTEHLAFALPKGRPQAVALLNQWLARDDTRALVAQAIRRAGMRGTVELEGRRVQ